MKKIKTIAVCSNMQEFDDKVNAAIADGWQLVRRFPVRLGVALPGIGTADGQPVGVYYAELEKETAAYIDPAQDPKAITENDTRLEARKAGRKKTNG